jgi:hypothetical protein
MHRILVQYNFILRVPDSYTNSLAEEQDLPHEAKLHSFTHALSATACLPLCILKFLLLISCLFNCLTQSSFH